MPLPTLADVMLEPVSPETYLPEDLRKSNAKALPVGGGRTPLQIARWDSFEQMLEAWWTQRIRSASAAPHDILAGKAALEAHPNRFLPFGSTTKEDGVRAALTACVFTPVNEALRSGLQRNFLLNATDSVDCVKSNVDWGGFIIRPDSSDLYVQCRLPVEVKPPWQFKLLDTDHVVELLSSNNKADRDKVRFAIAQIYLYMILEEAEYGVICSKEQFLFLKRVRKPEEKALLISSTFGCADSIGIRRCVLFICHLAESSNIISRTAVDQAGLTPLYRKLVTPKGMKRQRRIQPMQVRVQPDRRAKITTVCEALSSTQCRNRPAAHFTKLELDGAQYQELEWVYLKDDGPPLLSAEHMHRSGDWKVDTATVDHWFKQLAEFDIFSLKLGTVLSSGGNVIVRQGMICGVEAAIKMFDLTDDAHDTISEFYNEAKAYTVLQDLQGIAVPCLCACGTLWGGYMGFVALEMVGAPLTAEQLGMHSDLAGMAVQSLKLIHGFKVLHGDLSFKNMLVSPEGKNVLFIDFGMCSFDVQDKYLEVEMEDLVKLFEHGLVPTCDD